MRTVSTTIDQLQVDVQSNAQSAVSGIDALASSLGKLKTALKGGVGLATVSKQLTTLNTALNTISSGNADNLNKLANGLQTLAACGNLKLSSSVASQITSIGTAIQSLNGTNFGMLNSLANSLSQLSNVGKANLNSFISQLQRLPQAVAALNTVNIGGLGTQISQLTAALKPLSEMGKNNLTSFVTQIGKLPQMMAALNTVNIGELASQIQQLAAAFTPLGKQMQSIANGFSALPPRIQKLISSTNKLSAANQKASLSYINLGAKIALAVSAIRRIASVISGWIASSSQYVEDLNLFTVSMGSYAQKAKEYAESVSAIMGIDPGEWMRNQGTFMTLATGFGVVSDRAYTMSQNLTQLGYDIASFFNISYEEAFQKLQSGLAGELEPLRRIGYDLSNARLQQEAYRLGIEKKVSTMTQAEKAELRYYAIMTQVTAAHGDMARTLSAPANQLRILRAEIEQVSRALGNIFIPLLNKVLPYVIAFFRVIRAVADLIGKLVGFTLPDVDYSGLGSAAADSFEEAEESVEGTNDQLEEATKKVKELKNALLGIDELNIISPLEQDEDKKKEDEVDLDSLLNGSGFDFELPTYDFIGDAVSGKVDELYRKMMDWLGITEDIDTWAEFFDTRLGKILITVGKIGAAFGAWKIAKGISTFINSLAGLKLGGAGLGLLGFAGLMDSMNDFMEYLEDFLENGATLDNVVGLITSFAGGLGYALTTLGNTKTGGALIVIRALGEIFTTVRDMVENGVNWDNALDAIGALGELAVGIGVFTGRLDVAGWGAAIKGLAGIIQQIDEVWKALKTGDWSGVDKVSLAVDAIMLIGGVVTALTYIKTLKGVSEVGQAAKTIGDVTTAVGEAAETIGGGSAGGGLTTKLVTLVKNIGLGIAILAEVSAAAILLVGAVYVLGEELRAVGDAWQPVIENAGTVATAMGVGTGLLVAVGVATAALGTLGGAMAGQIGIGIAILAEMGAATLLFVAEIWAIGKGLEEVGKAWQPVLDNGETIAEGIGLGTALLVGIGVVTAALGVATVASAGLLPAAIALGTAILVELTAALILFVEELVAVAKELSNRLAPALDDLNVELPNLSLNMSAFVDYMTEFAGEVVRYTKVNAIASLSATIDTIIGWFTQDPVEKLANDVKKIYEQTQKLNTQLEKAVPELESAANLMKQYQTFLSEFEKLTKSKVELSNGMFVNMKEVGQNLVLGFVDGIKSKSSDFENAAKDLVKGFKSSLNDKSTDSKSSVTTWGSNIKTWFTDKSFAAINKATFEGYANDVVNAFKDRIKKIYPDSKTVIESWAKDVKKWFEDIVSEDTFYDLAKDVIDGFNNGINKFYKNTEPYMEKWANAAIKAYKEALDSHSPSRVFMGIGEDTVLGYNLGIASMGDTTADVVTSWADSFTSVSPTMSFAVDTSALKYYDSDSFAKSVSANVTSNSSVTATGFKEGMEEFYKEYIEPTVMQMAEDMRRQADKKEQTIVQIGNRVVSDAVTTQQKANGYSFAK